MYEANDNCLLLNRSYRYLYFSIVSFQDFQVITVDEIWSVLRLVKLLSIVHLYLQCTIVKEFLSNHLRRHLQVHLIIKGSCQSASLVSLGQYRFADIDFIAEELCRLSSMCNECLLI